MERMGPPGVSLSGTPLELRPVLPPDVCGIGECLHQAGALSTRRLRLPGNPSARARPIRGLIRARTPQRPDLPQPISISRAELDRTVLQQDQQCRRVATRYDKLAANY